MPEWIFAFIGILFGGAIVLPIVLLGLSLYFVTRSLGFSYKKPPKNPLETEIEENIKSIYDAE